MTEGQIGVKVHEFKTKNARKLGICQKNIVFGIFAKIGTILNKKYFVRVVSFCDKHLNSFEENRFSTFFDFHTALLNIKLWTLKQT